MKGKITTKSLYSGFRKFWDIMVILVLVLMWAFPEPILKTVIGLLLFFLPGYSLARFLFLYGKRDVTDFIIYTTIISFCLIPLLGNLVQVLIGLSSYSLLLASLVFSLPLLVFADVKLIRVEEIKTEVKNGNNTFPKAMAFLGAVAIGLGLYIQSSIGTVAPRGWDIFAHMNTVNRMITTGKAVVLPDLNMVSNFYHFAYAGLSLLTGLDVPSTGVLGQTMLGAVFVMGIFYFAHSISGSPTASFTSAVLFIAGPPIYSNAQEYFWYFHPMYVALAVLPFALACVHEALSGDTKRSLGLSSLLICTVALYHLTVGLILFLIMIFDFVFLLIKSRRKVLILDFLKISLVAFSFSSILTIPFLLNLTNPFKYVYPQGGLQTLYTMFFGVSTLIQSSRTYGPEFLAKVMSDFVQTILPLLLIGVPGLVYLFIKKRSSFILILSCLLTGLLGLLQTLIGLAFLPQRFSEGLTLFGPVVVSVSLLSLGFYLKALRGFLKRRVERIKISLKMPAFSLPKVLTLMLVFWLYISLYSYIVFYSPAKNAVLAAELEIKENDLIALKEIDQRVPKDSKVLMDQYLQLFFRGITGRNPLYILPGTVSYYSRWSLYPVNVYIGRTDPSSIDVDYIVISPWCYTTSNFVGKQYFDKNENLARIYEYAVESGPQAAYTGFYAVYKVIK